MSIQHIRLAGLTDEEKTILRTLKNTYRMEWVEVKLDGLNIHQIKKRVFEFCKKHKIIIECNLHEKENVVLFARSKRRKNINSMILNAIGFRTSFSNIKNRLDHIPEDELAKAVQFLIQSGIIKKVGTTRMRLPIYEIA